MKATSLTNPTKDKTGSGRVSRGGSWDFAPESVRPSYRDYGGPSSQYDDLGFRIVRNKQ